MKVALTGNDIDVDGVLMVKRSVQRLVEKGKRFLTISPYDR